MACATISENSRKSYVVDLANDVLCNFPREAMMNTFSSYETAYWLERISYNFLICACCCLQDSYMIHAAVWTGTENDRDSRNQVMSVNHVTS